MIVTGINIEDAINFMTSPSVKAISQLLQENIFDDYNPVSKLEQVLNILKGKFSTGKFIFGKSWTTTDDGANIKDLNINIISDAILKHLRTNYTESGESFYDFLIKNKYLEPLDPKEHRNHKIQEFVYAIYKTSVEGTIDLKADKVALSGQCAVQWNNLMDYMDRVLAIRRRSGNRFLFDEDIAQFEQILNQADEISTLGSTLLSLNQGIPVKKVDLIKKIIDIEEAINNQSRKVIPDPTKVSTYIPDILKNKPWLSRTDVTEIISKAMEKGIVQDFNFEQWVFDDDYRRIASDYYGVIKDTFNILDVIRKLPHYDAIFKLFRSAFVMDSVSIKKSEFLNYIVKDIRENCDGYKNYDKIPQLIGYIDSLFIKAFIKEKGITLPLRRGYNYINEDYDSVKINEDGATFTLDSNFNIAAFKKIFETNIVPALKSGNIQGVTALDPKLIQGLKNNAFIKALRFDTNSDGQSYIRLDIDMMNIESTPYNAIKYQECMSDFIKLKTVKLDGIPLTDLFMIYSLIINRTNFGEDRMTTLFSNFINIFRNENSIIRDYLVWLGDRDKSTKSVKDDLALLQYDLDDALYEIAPLISQYDEHNNTAPIVKELKDGRIIYKRRSKGFYLETDNQIIQEPTEGANKNLQKHDRYNNMKQYGMMSNPVSEFFNNSMTNLKSDKESDVAKALAYYMELGYFNIRINC